MVPVGHWGGAADDGMKLGSKTYSDKKWCFWCIYVLVAWRTNIKKIHLKIAFQSVSLFKS